MHVTWTFSGDGLITLVVGVLAFLGIIFTVRHSSKDVQKQIEAQQQASDEEREMRGRSIAMVILFEIDNFWRLELDAVEKTIGKIDPMKDPIPRPSAVRSNVFEIYTQNAGQLGMLGEQSASAITKFYMMASKYVAMLDDYNKILTGERGLNPALTRPAASAALAGLQGLIPQLKQLAATVAVKVAQQQELNHLIAKQDAQAHGH